MPYLRLSSLPLDDATKRHLADELTSTVLDVLTDQKPEWTTVHFTPFDPGDFAVAGRLVSDGAIADTHLEISAPEVDEKSWFALRNRLTDVLIEALAIPDSERWHVNVKLNRYDLHSFAVAGNAADELDDLASGEDVTWDDEGRGGGAELAPACADAGLRGRRIRRLPVVRGARRQRTRPSMRRRRSRRRTAKPSMPATRTGARRSTPRRRANTKLDTR